MYVSLRVLSPGTYIYIYIQSPGRYIFMTYLREINKPKSNQILMKRKKTDTNLNRKSY